jgi:hypothetical protein
MHSDLMVSNSNIINFFESGGTNEEVICFCGNSFNDSRYGNQSECGHA